MKENLGCLRAGDVIASASDIDELLRYRDLKEQGRLIILPEDEEKIQVMNEKLLELIDIAETALKGADNAVRQNHILKSTEKTRRYINMEWFYENVYDCYYDTVGNLHWHGGYAGNHVFNIQEYCGLPMTGEVERLKG